MAMREIEFEFDESGGGEFRASGNVIEVIGDYVRRDEIDRAASLLAAAGPDVGDRLIAEAEVGASREHWRKLAAVFGEARDVARAARCAERIDDLELAAGFFEASYDWPRAAEAYARAGNQGKAAEMHERSLAFDRAAAAYLEAGDHLRAADCYARAGAYYHAGHLYMRLSRWEKAVEVLQRVERMQQWYVESSLLLGQFFERTGNLTEAAQRYAEVVRNRPIDRATVGAHTRLAEILSGAGHEEKAQRLWRAVLEFDPSHEAARARVKQLGPAGDAGMTAAISASAQDAPASASAQDAAAFASAAGGGEVTPLVLPGDDAPEAQQPLPAGVVAVRGDFDVLRGLPILKPLSLDELRAMHTLADRRTYRPGERLIEQGEKGEALLVVAAGEVKVEVVGDDGAAREVARLGTGAALGEMSMVDLAPASARVTAVEQSSVFAFPFDRLGSHLEADPRVGYKILRVLGRILSARLREANQRLAGN